MVGQLADMPASEAARRLDAVPAARAVEVLTEMDDEVVGDILGAMQRTAAAAALTTMPLAVAAELLLRTQYDQRAGILSQLSAEAAPVILAEMPDWITVLAQSRVAPDKVVQFWRTCRSTARLPSSPARRRPPRNGSPSRPPHWQGEW
ncbi:magnesium transporter MgtE N-terminal domain-containing protein [Micromonospora sp. NBC_00617]|uniref:magnesium transporter MgtE N-terminal domain-containing protein n=1 Tax=Micromonospora sp. NBC_00617 TaxID=2903587 RepID=UPI0030E39444